MQTKDDKAQLNIRIPEAALKAISAAASEEDKKVADYVRIAALTAVCHTRRKVPSTVFIDPREQVNIERARGLGMTPVVDLGGKWQGEVRVSIGKNGLLQDRAGGVWVLTPQGLKQVMGFEPDEEAERLAVRNRRASK